MGAEKKDMHRAEDDRIIRRYERSSSDLGENENTVVHNHRGPYTYKIKSSPLDWLCKFQGRPDV